MDREQLEKYLETYTLEEILDYNNMDLVDLLLLAGESADFELPYTKPL